MAQLVKDPPAMQETQETQVWSLVREDPLKKEMATCPSILAWKIPWTEEPGGLQPMGSQNVKHDLVAKQQKQIFDFCPSVDHQGWFRVLLSSRDPGCSGEGLRSSGAS